MAQWVVWTYQKALIDALIDILAWGAGEAWGPEGGGDLEEVLEEAEGDLVEFFQEVEKHLGAGENMKKYWANRFAKARSFSVVEGQGRIEELLTA